MFKIYINNMQAATKHLYYWFRRDPRNVRKTLSRNTRNFFLIMLFKNISVETEALE